MKGSNRPRQTAGYTILELMISLVVLTIAVGGISSSLASTSALSRATEERGVAMDVALGIMEELRATEPIEVYRRYNQTDLDDLPGWNPGPFFEVPGLDLRQDDVDGFAGEITFPGNGTQLFETGNDAELGLPRDLNGDGVTDAVDTDHALDYTILPVRIRVEWTGARGVQRIDLYSQVGVL